jgi:hypothetical protein
MARHAQPQVGGQHHILAPNTLAHTAVTLSISHELQDVPAPGSLATQRVRGSFSGRERGDLERPQYRFTVLTAQPTGFRGVGAQFPRGVPAVQSPSHEQVVHLLPGFGQRSHDLLQPVPQRRPPRRGTPHIRLIQPTSLDAGLQRPPIDGVGPGRQSRRELGVVRDAQQPVPQAVRMRQLRRISHRQIGDDEKVTGSGDRGVGIGPQPLGVPCQHRIAMLADHAVEHRRAIPFGDSLPEPPDQRGIGLSPVVPCYETHSIHSQPDLPTSRTPQQASTYDYKRQAPPFRYFSDDRCP